MFRAQVVDLVRLNEDVYKVSRTEPTGTSVKDEGIRQAGDRVHGELLPLFAHGYGSCSSL